MEIGGVGRHTAALAESDPAQLVTYAKCLLAIEWIYLLSVTLPKLSILGIFLRLFHTRRTYRYIVYVLAGIIILSFVASGLAATLACRPLSYSWDKTIPGGRCFDVDSFYRWISLPNIVTDVAMLILPLKVIWGMNMKRNQKIGVALTFLTGSL